MPLPAPEAKFLIIVVYSRNQLLKEETANIKKEQDNKLVDFDDAEFLPKIDWGIVAILGQMEDREEPINYLATKDDEVCN